MEYESNIFFRFWLKLHDFIIKNEVFLVLLSVYFIYNINCRTLGSGDTIPASLLPFSILEYHNLYMDNFYFYYFSNYDQLWYFKEADGHFLSSYPIVTPLLITPLYVIPYIVLKFNNLPIDLFHPGFAKTVCVMEKLSASLIASTSVVFVYLSIKELINRRVAFIVAVLFAFGTNTWAISSQALWQHGLIELILAMFIYLVLINEKIKSNKIVISLGVLSGLFVFNRPIDSVLLAPVLYYIFDMRDKRIIYYIFSAFSSGAPFLLYNIYYFGNLFGGYTDLLKLFDLSPEMVTRFAGLLVSPSRGLFVYTPITLLSVLGFAKVMRIPNKRIKNFLILMGISCFTLVIIYSSFIIWWAGGSYGPRFLTGMLPAMAIFLGFFIKDIKLNVYRFKNLSIIFIVSALVFWSFFTQFVGAFYYPNGNWDGDPNVDLHPEKLWDWKDTQLTRTFNAGMASSPLSCFKNIFSAMSLLHIKDISDYSIMKLAGWYGIELWNNVPTRWMQDDAKVALKSPDNQTCEMSLQATSFYHPRTLEIYAGDEKILTVEIPSDGFINLSVPVSLVEGMNVIRMHVPEGCERPCDIKELNNPDSRCLSIAVQNLKIMPSESIIYYTPISGFYGIESWSGIPTNWIMDDADLGVFSLDNLTCNLSIRARSFHCTRTLEIYAGNAFINSVSVPSDDFINVTCSIKLARGMNTIQLRVPDGCDRPSDIREINVQDRRCLSMALQNVRIDCGNRLRCDQSGERTC
ncbi:hypothetical protein [Methanothrix thermoacetophila]|uniref:Glycosyltransferase RgtA/B/C/D-like domain-containing protein n=1 Tax=Methanothrix thermoacetophila (strain DSM 6194 / JCM 14653 / NBRC 101360 / PT) TaxID=349307 RepID=A0B835_METTP|nr:hypothetical protein [Methanothrix thermoacetophila]ABK14859.1 hypothetical protein Mthe_1075 [Methanothrix thermoacetophila PT]